MRGLLAGDPLGFVFLARFLLAQVDLLLDGLETALQVHLGQLVGPLTHLLQLRLIFRHFLQRRNNANR